jgi:hypothetical protein
MLMRSVFILVCIFCVKSAYSASLGGTESEPNNQGLEDIEEYLADYHDYPDAFDKRGGRRSLVEQLSALMKNMKNGELSVNKRAPGGPKVGILNFLYDLARKYKRGMRGDPRAVMYQYRRNY